MSAVFSLVTQNTDFIVIDKHEEASFHTENDLPGLFEQVKSELNLPTLYPVHRLDKMTTGLIIFALNLSSAQIFQQLFEQKNVEKFYLALSTQKPKKKQGCVKGDMLRSRRKSWKLSKQTTSPAITYFKSINLEPNLRLFLLKPLTGKTHQLRVAMASLGAPIIGDPIYNASSTADRGYLHAYSLGFIFRNEQYQFRSIPRRGNFFLNDVTQLALTTEYKAPELLAWPKRSN